MKKIPILYVGAPGIGKTAKVKSKYDYCEVLLLSSQTEEDIAGIPYQENGLEKRTIPPFVQRLQKAKGSRCLFLDEIDKARREVADTLLTLITDQEKFGIPEDVEIIAAANPPEWGGGDGVSIPMMNRFSIIESGVDIEGFSNYIIEKYGKNDFILSVLDSLKSGEMPILEIIGEGLNARLTSPRSIDYALSALLFEKNEEKVIGLLTPNVASGVMRLYRKENNEETNLDNIQEMARIVSTKKINPIRL